MADPRTVTRLVKNHQPFFGLCHHCGLPLPEPEYRFAPPRRWRFDYAWPAAKVALEVEGGAWIRGRHTRGKGFLADMAKYNQATMLGWKVLRTTPEGLLSLGTVAMLKAVL